MNYEEIFAPVDSIALDASVIISGILSMDVSNSGSILVVDQASAVYLFDRVGRHMASLFPKQCHPGTDLNAIFRSDDSIVVINGGAPYGFLFGPNGECIDKLDDSFRPPFFLNVLDDNSLIGFSSRLGDSLVTRLNEFGVRTSTFGHSPDSQVLNRRFRGGGLVATDLLSGYFSQAHSANVSYYNNGAITDTLHYTPTGYRAPKSDLDSTG